MEIEKKFLVQTMPEVQSVPRREIEQGYLCTNPVVRIRKSDDQFWLTYKAPAAGSVAGLEARVNREEELPLTREAYFHLREKADDHLIGKTRYLLALPDGHTGELDVFHGRLEGLFLIEVEFASEEEARDFTPPAWFGENVSMDHRFANSFLSSCDDLSALEV